MLKSKGTRRGTRKFFSKSPSTIYSLKRFLITFKKGDRVRINYLKNQKGINYPKRFQNKIGTVLESFPSFASKIKFFSGNKRSKTKILSIQNQHLLKCF